MSISRRGFLASCLSAGAFALTGCNLAEPTQRERWYLFGTLVDVTLTGREQVRHFAPTLEALSSQLQAAHHDWHAWKPGQLQRLNQAFTQGEALAVDAELAGLLQATGDMYSLSGGAFNPAIGSVIGLWGFHNDELPRGAPPRQRQIERLLSDHPSPLDLVVADGRLASRNPQVQFDLGGYGKGYALNRGMALLQEKGMENAVINAGGDLCVMGTRQGRPWRIAIRHPQGRGALTWLESHGSEAVFTSGNYERYRQDGDKRYAHILDPRSGRPVEEVVSATVVHGDGAVADATATALMVTGSKGWYDVARDMGVSQAMIVDRDGRIQVTRALAERLQLDHATRRRTLVV